jgi:hypothetical protein
VICYLVTADGHPTITKFLRTRGRSFTDTVRVVLYEHLPFVGRLPAGTFLFADVERLSPAAAESATALWNTLAAQGDAVRLLNHPTRSMKRYELLRTLHEDGVNEADVYGVTELRSPVRFPAFVRRADDHAGSLSDLLHSNEALAREVERLTRAGARPDDLIVTEFCDTSGADGCYRKYSAFRVDDRIVPRHAMFSRDWRVKIIDLHGAAEVTEELVYVRENPHRDALMRIFERARIEFGRIDYGLRDGRIQVWEINTNPLLGTFDDGGMPARAPVLDHVTPAFAAALRALDRPDVPPRSLPVRQGSRLERLRRRLRPVVETLLRACGLARYEIAILVWLGALRRRLLG